VIDERTELPPLDLYVVEADEELADVVDAVVRGELRAHERLLGICEHLELLRACVEPDVWKLVEEIRARIRERDDALALVIVRWGFDQGRRFPPPSKAGSS